MDDEDSVRIAEDETPVKISSEPEDTSEIGSEGEALESSPQEQR